MRNYKHVLWNEDGDVDDDGGRVERKLYEKGDLYTVNYISNHHPLYRNQRRVDVDVDKVGDGMGSRGDELINYTKDCRERKSPSLYTSLSSCAYPPSLGPLSLGHLG